MYSPFRFVRVVCVVTFPSHLSVWEKTVLSAIYLTLRTQKASVFFFVYFKNVCLFILSV